MGCASSTEEVDASRQRYEVKPAEQAPKPVAAPTATSDASKTTDAQQKQQQQHQQQSTPTAPSATTDEAAAAQPPPSVRPDNAATSSDAATAHPPKAPRDGGGAAASGPVITLQRHRPSSGPATGSGGHSRGADHHGNQPPPAADGGHRSPTGSSAYLTASGVSTPGEQAADSDPSGAKRPFGRFVRGHVDEPDPVRTGEVWSMKGALGTALAMCDFVGDSPPAEPLTP